MKRRHKRLIALGIGVVVVGVGLGLILRAFDANILYFFSPTEVLAGQATGGNRIRLGGMVVDDSFEQLPGDLNYRFAVTDYDHTVPVRYQGMLPDLFREGQGVVAEGRIGADGTFVAERVLAKHDENYMPPEVADMLESSAAKN